jgi:capsular polysaccharide export protein
MIKQGIRAFRGKRVLLLQGPVGPFFLRLARDLTRSGAQVFKVNFNGGDWLFSPEDAFNYRGTMEGWPAYFEKLVDRLSIDVVMLFGDCRQVHRAAHEIASRRGMEIGVFEEGYVRPDFVTLERFGVNGHSLIPRNPIFYLNSMTPPAVEHAAPVGNTFRHMVMWAILYYLAASFLKPWFRQYRHHRPLTWLEGAPWIRAAWRKAYYSLRELGLEDRFTGALSKRFFLVPLQVHNDAQVHVHSPFDSVAHFIADVIESFARNAPRTMALVIKHHPADRGYYDYTRLIGELAAKHGLQGRCYYIHDQHLPTLLKHARGVVVINSTVGLQALFHGTPVKACGKAVYDMEGLTFRDSLAHFWNAAQTALPNRELYRRFRHYLIRFTQLNGSFYKRLPVPEMATGMRWTEHKHHGRVRQGPEGARSPHQYGRKEGRGDGSPDGAA